MRGKTTRRTSGSEHECFYDAVKGRKTHRGASCYGRVFGWFQLFAVARVLYAPSLAPDGQGLRFARQRARVVCWWTPGLGQGRRKD
jgi:hypothetical protein